jgi:hypothetical protein
LNGAHGPPRLHNARQALIAIDAGRRLFSSSLAEFITNREQGAGNGSPSRVNGYGGNLKSEKIYDPFGLIFDRWSLPGWENCKFCLYRWAQDSIL